MPHTREPRPVLPAPSISIVSSTPAGPTVPVIRRHPLRFAVVTAGLTLFAAVGCGSDDAPKAAESSSGSSSSASSGATAESTGADCTAVDVPLTEIPSGNGEPMLSIPQPPGWEPSEEVTNEMIPFAMVNADLVSEGFAPTAVVTRESVDGKVPAEDVFESNRSTLTAAGGADLQTTQTSVCGQPAERVEYTCPPTGQVGPRPCRLLNVVAPTDDRTFLITVTVQTTDPANPTYQQDSSAILDGFQVTPPAS